jgi:dihydropteroate synthase
VPPGRGGDAGRGGPGHDRPGSGPRFAKRAEHNWALLTHLQEVSSLGGRARPFPVLIGASRKRFLGRLLAGPDGTPRPFAESDDATVSATALAAAAGAWCARVHRVPGNADAVRVAEAWREAVRTGAGPAGEARSGEAQPGQVQAGETQAGGTQAGETQARKTL